MDKENVLRVLDGVVHPETGGGLAEGGFVADVTVTNGKEAGEIGGVEGVGGVEVKRSVEVVLKFRRTRDPFAASLVRQADEK